MTADTNPYPLTGSWHTGEWTSEVCERLWADLSAPINDSVRAQYAAIDARDWAAADECDERLQYLGACRRELESRRTMLRRFEHAQWTGTAEHRLLRWSVLSSVLRAARGGTLAVDWRDGLEADVAERNRNRQGTNAADVGALVVHELATMSQQAWEPYVAGGDWRTALGAWYRDSLALHEWEWEQEAVELEWTPGWARRTRERFAAEFRARHVRGRDELEASYRAGLAAGGDDQDWIGWYRRRITETWGSGSGMGRYDSEETLRALDARDEWLMDMERLPSYWAARQP